MTVNTNFVCSDGLPRGKFIKTVMAEYTYARRNNNLTLIGQMLNKIGQTTAFDRNSAKSVF